MDGRRGTLGSAVSDAEAYEILLETVASEPGSGESDALIVDDREPLPWESGLQATCECLSWRGSLDNLERRHAEDELGETIYSQAPVEAKSVVVTTHSLLDRGLIDEDDLRAKMREVRERFEKT